MRGRELNELLLCEVSGGRQFSLAIDLQNWLQYTWKGFTFHGFW
jgi:hypothetical protein